MRFPLPALCLAIVAGCGGEPDATPSPALREEQVLSDAAEMLPDEMPQATSTAAPTASEADAQR